MSPLRNAGVSSIPSMATLNLAATRAPLLAWSMAWTANCPPRVLAVQVQRPPGSSSRPRRAEPLAGRLAPMPLPPPPVRPVLLEEIHAARERIQGVAIRTPLVKLRHDGALPG